MVQRVKTRRSPHNPPSMKRLNGPLLALTFVLALTIASSAGLVAAAPRSPCDGLQAAGVLQQVNAARAQGAVCGRLGGQAPAGALIWSEPLQAMAQQQAAWMAELGGLNHLGRNGESLAQRAQAADYRYDRIGENLALGQTSLAQALAGWTASEGHCLNLYDSRVTEMALACVPGRDGRPYWAMLTGRPR